MSLGIWVDFDLLDLSVRNTPSEGAHWLFLILCMKLGLHKGSSDGSQFLKGKKGKKGIKWTKMKCERPFGSFILLFFENRMYEKNLVLEI